MKAYLQELWHSLKKNKLRTFLTGFTVAWGIIILVVILGSGEGIKNGIISMQAQFGTLQPTLTMSLRQTTVPYAGFQENRSLYLTQREFAYLQEVNYDYVEAIEPSLDRSFKTGSTTYGNTYFEFTTLTMSEMELSPLDIKRGRQFSKTEHEEESRVCIVTENMLTHLFDPSEDPIGGFVTVDGLDYQVVGVIETASPFFGSMTIPYSTYISVYPNEALHIKSFKVYPMRSDLAFAKEVEKLVESSLRQVLKIAPEDAGAIDISGSTEMADVMNNVFTILNAILWLMGIGSLSVGTVGVSNIMHVSVQERMREIGIRKAIGAKPRDITLMVLGESLLLSLVSGIIGLMIGMGIVAVMDYGAEVNGWGTQVFPTGMGQTTTFTLFTDPSVSLSVGIGAMIVLVIAGVVAGYGPAKKAVRIPAIVAMRDTK